MGFLLATQSWCDHLFGWINWDAVAAIGTVGTLVWALILAGGQAAEERRRSAARIKALMVPLALAYDAARPALNSDLNARYSRISSVISSNVIDHAIEQIARMDPLALPSSLAVDVLGRSPAQLRSLKSELEAGMLGGLDEARAQMALKQLAGSLGSLGRVATRLDRSFGYGEKTSLILWLKPAVDPRQRFLKAAAEILGKASQLLQNMI